MTNRGTLGPLRGWKILVPRGGTFGHDVAEAVRARGAFPITAPLINFASPAPDDSPRLMDALVRLERGEYDWLVVTSATAVDVMHSLQARVPESTRIAAAGETTATALSAGGFRVDFVPTHDNSAKGLLVEWRESGRRMPKINVLWLHSEHSKPSFANGLKRRGHNVDSVIAYRSVGVPAAESIQYDIRNGRIRGVLITSGSVAEQVRKQFSPIPDELLLAAIGPRTAKDARALGLRIDVIARQRSVASLLDGMEWYVCGEPLAETSALDLRELMRLEREELEGEVPPEDVPAVDEERPETGIIKLPPNADR
ncbi:uroporphyrinogen-III synthase [Gulosibacter faecalis]|uniref:Uroporphyrinogen-III synthase n=1 Tax=Gulosibacter faecalis TaxID=272240 RepID=A0ABW5UZ37_9MICO|nr:uroporphyrinogen-III synthase [Gulosibacter faecalis]